MATIEKRVSGDGTVTYRVKIRLKGHAPETASFGRRTDARMWAQRIEADIKARRHFGVSKRHTLAELLDRYEATELPKLKSARTVKAKLDWWRHRHGEKQLAMPRANRLAPNFRSASQRRVRITNMSSKALAGSTTTICRPTA